MIKYILISFVSIGGILFILNLIKLWIDDIINSIRNRNNILKTIKMDDELINEYNKIAILYSLIHRSDKAIFKKYTSKYNSIIIEIKEYIQLHSKSKLNEEQVKNLNSSINLILESIIDVISKEEDEKINSLTELDVLTKVLKKIK